MREPLDTHEAVVYHVHMSYGNLTDDQEKLLTKHFPFVKHIAGSLAASLPASVDIDDLEAAGRIGLLNAVVRYNPESGTFLSFCKHHIRGAMLDEIRGMDWIGRTYRGKGGDLPMMRDFSAHEDEDTGFGIESVDEGVQPADKAAAADMVKWLLDRLPGREARIVWAHHGPEQMTYAEIALELGISDGRVSHLYHRAKAKMLYFSEKLDHDPLD